MRIKIVFRTSEDLSYEEVNCIINGEEVAKVSTSSDSPEDNNLRRMGMNSFLNALIQNINPDIEIENVREELRD